MRRCLAERHVRSVGYDHATIDETVSQRASERVQDPVTARFSPFRFRGRGSFRDVAGRVARPGFCARGVHDPRKPGVARSLSYFGPRNEVRRLKIERMIRNSKNADFISRFLAILRPVAQDQLVNQPLTGLFPSGTKLYAQLEAARRNRIIRAVWPQSSLVIHSRLAFAGPRSRVRQALGALLPFGWSTHVGSDCDDTVRAGGDARCRTGSINFGPAGIFLDTDAISATLP